MTDDELRDWARDQVPERAAAPKAVTVLDALPVTAVGKPYKLALRADATREAVADALARHALESPASRSASRTARSWPSSAWPDGADEAAVKAILDRYAIAWRLEVS